MNFSRHFIAGLWLVAAFSAAAQSSPSPAHTPAAAAAADAASVLPTPSPSATAAVEPPSLIPPNILPAPGAGALPQIPNATDLGALNALFKQTSLGKAADEHRLHLQMSALEVRIRNDEELHALLASANQAHTDLERRHRFKAYYQLYYKKLVALATTPDLQAYLQAQEAGKLASLLQPRVRHETDEVLAQAGGATPVKPLATPVQAHAGNELRVRP